MSSDVSGLNTFSVDRLPMSLRREAARAASLGFGDQTPSAFAVRLNFQGCLSPVNAEAYDGNRGCHDTFPALGFTIVPMLAQVLCPAKVNLFLAVGPKDSRNYHPLRTIFQAIDLCDVVTIEKGEGKHRVVFDDPSIPADNTVTRALRLLNEVISLPPLLVTIEKHIPAESGLGGGSSDAAGVLRAAQKIAGVSIPLPELSGIAQAIGMDVPFFLTGGRAKAEGYGHIVTAQPDAPTEWIVVARPAVGTSTPEAYRQLDDKTYEWRDFPSGDELYNDFERVAPCESLDLIEALQTLGAKDAGLSGSGSAVFGRFDSEESAKKCVAQITEKGAQRAWVARSLTRSESLRMSGS